MSQERGKTMQLRPTYHVEPTEEEKASQLLAEETAKAERHAAAVFKAAEEAKANGATVSLSEKSLTALAPSSAPVRFQVGAGNMFALAFAVVLGNILSGILGAVVYSILK